MEVQILLNKFYKYVGCTVSDPTYDAFLLIFFKTFDLCEALNPYFALMRYKCILTWGERLEVCTYPKPKAMSLSIHHEINLYFIHWYLLGIYSLPLPFL
jgi:hypothetical protein